MGSLLIKAQNPPIIKRAQEDDDEGGGGGVFCAAFVGGFGHFAG
jgi:hypothetical protein